MPSDYASKSQTLPNEFTLAQLSLIPASPRLLNNSLHGNHERLAALEHSGHKTQARACRSGFQHCGRRGPAIRRQRLRHLRVQNQGGWCSGVGRQASRGRPHPGDQWYQAGGSDAQSCSGFIPDSRGGRGAVRSKKVIPSYKRAVRYSSRSCALSTLSWDTCCANGSRRCHLCNHLHP